MTKKKLPHLVVFDLDGTLVDSGKYVASLLNDLRIELGKPVLPLSSYVPWLSLGGLQLIENGLEVSSNDAPDLLAEFRRVYKHRPTPDTLTFPYVKDVLAELSLRGIKQSICTNKPRLLAEKVLRDLKLFQFFDYINAGGDLPTQKPHPENLLSCLEATGINSSHAILVGDSVVDQYLAEACGVRFCWYSGGNDDGVDRSKVDMQFECFSQFLNLFKEQCSQHH